MPRPSEDELIATYFAPLAGPGAFGLRDDAAILAQRPGQDLVVTTDMLTAGVHFFADDPPGAIARKASPTLPPRVQSRAGFSLVLPCQGIGRPIGSRASRKGLARTPRPTIVRSWAATL